VAESLQDLDREFAEIISDLNLTENLGVAVSGGADSMALMLLTARWARTRGFAPPRVVTVDHRLRPEARQEARQVAQWARTRGLAHTTLNGPAQYSNPDSNLQAQARQTRYRLLYEFCRAESVSHLLTAHTLDDQAETVLLRLARGSGLDGLAGMRQMSPFPVAGADPAQPFLVRPLLRVPGERLRQYLIVDGQPWIEDPSNSDLRFARVRMRKALAHLDGVGLSAARIAKAADNLRRAADALSVQAAACLAQSAVFHREGYVELNTRKLLEAPPDTVLRSLARVLRFVGGGPYPPRLDRLQHLVETLAEALDHDGAREPSPLARTLSGCRIVQDTGRNGHCLVFREIGRVPKATKLALATGTGSCIFDNRFRLTVRAADDAASRAIGADLEGCVIDFLGETGRTRFDAWLKQQTRSACDAIAHQWTSIPKPVRPTLPALWRESSLIAVPHLLADPLARTQPGTPQSGPRQGCSGPRITVEALRIDLAEVGLAPL